MSGPTSTPWLIQHATTDAGPMPFIEAADGRDVCDLYFISTARGHGQHFREFDNAEANAALIVRAVNGHHALIRALRGMLAEWDKFTRYGSPMAKQANEAVSYAREVLEQVSP